MDQETRSGIGAKVDRILLSGATARVELTGRTGTNGDARDQHFEVEITRQELANRGIAPGQPVRLTSSRLKAFPLDRKG